jgi:hypothetical protein
MDTRGIESGVPPREESLWAYAYQLQPPRTTDVVSTIAEIVNRENADALRSAGNWTARLVTEPQVTHVLVLSDTPEQDREMNRRLEARLRELDIPFTVSLPMRVDEAAPGTSTP